MNKKYLRWLSLGFFALGLFLVALNLRLTGAVIGVSGVSGLLSFLALIFFASGFLLLVIGGRKKDEGGLEKKTKTEKAVKRLKETKKRGKVGTYQELRGYAERMGYELKEGGKHTSVYKSDRLITQIPRHKGNPPKGTYLGIVKSLIENI